jgi:hypothetical protein
MVERRTFSQKTASAVFAGAASTSGVQEARRFSEGSLLTAGLLCFGGCIGGWALLAPQPISRRGQHQRRQSNSTGNTASFWGSECCRTFIARTDRG